MKTLKTMAAVAFILKGLLYVTLLVCFIIFYFYHEMMTFMKRSTKFARSYAKVEPWSHMHQLSDILNTDIPTQTYY